MSIEKATESDVLIKRKAHLISLKDRLKKYKTKNELIIQREIEEETKQSERDALKKIENERMEAERKVLLEELQKAELQRSTIPNMRKVSTYPQPQTVLQLQLEWQQQLQMLNQQPHRPQQTPQSNAMSFGYPTTVTEKEAISWLKNGF
ncbi:hypothetical protein BY458DRAFT_500828 [Sporodiniella umbellata]|nr:hypothetical protein BY458DRAFT_500828 [Sporodiniella umbellata]